jgi:hypothetical protein
MANEFKYVIAGILLVILGAGIKEPQVLLGFCALAIVAIEFGLPAQSAPTGTVAPVTGTIPVALAVEKPQAAAQVEDLSAYVDSG